MTEGGGGRGEGEKEREGGIAEKGAKEPKEVCII